MNREPIYTHPKNLSMYRFTEVRKGDVVSVYPGENTCVVAEVRPSTIHTGPTTVLNALSGEPIGPVRTDSLILRQQKSLTPAVSEGNPFRVGDLVLWNNRQEMYEVIGVSGSNVTIRDTNQPELGTITTGAKYLRHRPVKNKWKVEVDSQDNRFILKPEDSLAEYEYPLNKVIDFVLKELGVSK